MKSRKILIIEDDKKISDLVKLYLEKEGCEVLVAFDGITGIKMYETENPEFIILDLMLPGMDGLEIARTIRSSSSVPILMLTAKSEEIDKILGLEMGADDYLTKPFSPKELVARVKAIFRRTDSKSDSTSSGTIKIADLEIDKDKYIVRQKNNLLTLSVLEFKLLYTLASRPGQVFSRDQLMDQIYTTENEIVLDRTIDVHIKNLRKKLNDNPKNPTYIESVFGVGYRFVEHEN